MSQRFHLKTMNQQRYEMQSSEVNLSRRISLGVREDYTGGDFMVPQIFQNSLHIREILIYFIIDVV